MMEMELIMNKIGWCSLTLNPITGCTPVSPGCDHCYAARLAKRRMGEWAERDFSIIQFHPERLLKKLGKRPQRIFMNSMWDVGHPAIRREWLEAILDFVRENPQHQFIFLTKRPENLIREDWEGLPNIVLGVSVEDQDVLERVMSIYDWNVKRVVSFEPLLEGVSVPSVILSSLDWVIIGVETGPVRRLCNFEWIERIVQDCTKWKIPLFVKVFPKGYPMGKENQDYLQQFKEFPK